MTFVELVESLRGQAACHIIADGADTAYEVEDSVDEKFGAETMSKLRVCRQRFESAEMALKAGTSQEAIAGQ